MIYSNATPGEGLAIAALFGYLLGSIPFGLLFARFAGAGDVRKIGSGNIGATNVLRTGKRWAAAATLLCDAGKGALAVLLTWPFGPGAALSAGFGAFLGHIFPVWLGFRGGKGVATFLGVVASLDWRAGALAAVIWLSAAALFRISSLSALVAAAAAPLCFAAFGSLAACAMTTAMALLIFLTHRQNIVRLVRGEEPRIGRKAGAP